MPDSIIYDEKTPAYKLLTWPKWTWRVIIGGSFNTGLTISFTDETVPNWFHRKMQTLILGFRWERIDK